MAQLSTSLPYDQMLTKWASALNPVLANLLLQGTFANQIVLVSGVNIINHRLGRNQIGYFITDQNALASIYRFLPFNDTQLGLISNATVTVNIWNF